MRSIHINMSPKNKIIVWKNKKIFLYLYNDTKKLKLFINKNNSIIKIDKETNTLIIKRNEFNNCLILKKINNFLKIWDIYHFSKIKFKGKGFRIRFLKKNKFVKFFFGRSHKTFIFFKKIIMKKINKYKFILKSIFKNKILFVSKIITKIKPMNVYTLRGIRKSKQIIFKRKGKKGTYI